MNLFQAPTVEYSSTSGSSVGLIATAEDELKELYAFGVSQCVYGIHTASELQGLSFSDAAARVFKEHGVLLLAVQLRGRVMLNPTNHQLTSADVVFCVTDSEDKLKSLRQSETLDDWAESYENGRDTSYVRDLLLGITKGDIAQKLQNWKNKMRCELETQSPQSPSSPTAGWFKHQAQEDRKFNIKDVSKRKSFVSKPIGEQSSASAPSHGLRQLSMENGSDSGPKLQSVGRLESIGRTEVQRNVKLVDADSELKEAIRIAQQGGHILLLGCSTGLWQQVVSFLRCLRGSCCEMSDVPVIVLLPEPAPAQINGMFGENVAFLDGSPLQGYKLEGVSSPCDLPGIEHAFAVAVLSGKLFSDDPMMVDARTVMCANGIEYALSHCKHSLQHAIYGEVSTCCTHLTCCCSQKSLRPSIASRCFDPSSQAADPDLVTTCTKTPSTTHGTQQRT